MKISEIGPTSKKVDVSGKVTALTTTRDVDTKFGPGQVSDATLTDESGSITLVLWNENIAKVKKGSTVKITNGYVKTYQGKMSLNTGKYGKLTVVA